MKNAKEKPTNQETKTVARIGIMIAGIVIFVYFLGLFMMPVYAR